MKTIYLIRHSIKENMPLTSIDRQKEDEMVDITEEGRRLALNLANVDFLKDINEVWSSSYKRAYETAKCIFGEKHINVIRSFDERHYGTFDGSISKDEFWTKQFLDEDYKNVDGESQIEVRKRFEDKINYILNKSKEDKIAIVSHNAGIIFYILKYCKLIKAETPKKLTIMYNDKILINEGIMKSPSIVKLTFDENVLKDIDYIEY